MSIERQRVGKSKQKKSVAQAYSGSLSIRTDPNEAMTWRRAL
ncbi:Uncharacterised protein [uncultured archaeon]|nr:Uncharacterised protein [uncultured archaeon]